MAIRKDKSFYKSVPMLEEHYDEVVPEDGKEWIIESMEGVAPSSSEGYVALVWDYEGDNEEMLFLTYTSDSKILNRVIVGDGVKRLAVVLHNESGTTLAMGGSYKAKEL